jgi:hypothetical protein
MFKELAKVAYEYLPGSELRDVKDFIANSDEMKNMRKIQLLNPSKTDLLKIVTDIDSAVTFKKILELTDRLDFNNTNDPSVKTLGRNGMNAIFFFGGFFNADANFGYYMLHFREKAIEVMAQKGYQAEKENPVAAALYSNSN